MRFLRKLAVLAMLAVVYFIAGKLGLRLAYVHPSATAVWPPTGIALAAFLILGYWVWPAILLSAFLLNQTTAGTVATSVGIAVGNTLEGIVGAYLVKRFAGGRSCFDRTQSVFKFAGLAALFSTPLSATIGVTSLSMSRFASLSNYGPIWFTLISKFRLPSLELLYGLCVLCKSVDPRHVLGNAQAPFHTLPHP